MRNTKIKSSKRILTAIANYFIENIKAYTFIAIIFIIGIILAIVFINNLDESQRNEISTYITTFTNSLKDGYTIEKCNIMYYYVVYRLYSYRNTTCIRNSSI